MSNRHHSPASPGGQCRSAHRLAPWAVSALCLLSSPYLIGSATALTAARGRGAAPAKPFGLASSTTTMLLSSSSSTSSIESSYWGSRISTTQTASRHHSPHNKNRLSMDLEVPHPTYTTTQSPQGGFLNVVRTSAAAASIPTATVRIPSAASTTKADSPSASSSSPAYFQRFWDTQLDVMHQRLRNLEEIPLSAMSSEPSLSHKDMSLVENDSSVMITKAFRSDEYAYVRMTLLKGKHSQVFTSVWYPRSPELPILACDLLQFGGTGQQQRHLCIVDYQPVIVPPLVTDNVDEDAEAAAIAANIAQHNLDINNKVESIRRQYPGLHGQMSKRFYPEGSPYFSQQMLLGRHVKAPANVQASPSPHDDSVPSYETAHEMVHDVYEAYQMYMDRHVSWAQQQQQDADDNVGQPQQVRIERHSQYDKFSSQYDPALPMLSHMYGSDFADTYVHDVLFPLSRR